MNLTIVIDYYNATNWINKHKCKRRSELCAANLIIVCVLERLS